MASEQGASGPKPSPAGAAEATVGRLGTRRAHVMAVVVGLITLGLLWGGLFHYLGARELSAREQAERDASNLAIALEEQVERTILGVDQVMRFAHAEWQSNPAGFDLKVWMSRASFLSDLSLQIAMANAAGDVVATSLDAPSAPRINIADREHFRIHKERPDLGLFVSRPVLGRVSGRWSIQMSRRLSGLDGSFAGVLVVSLDPDYLARQFSTFDVGSGGRVALIGRDGYLRAWSPMRDGVYDRRISEEPAELSFLNAVRPSQTALRRAVSTVDGVERIAAFRAVSHLPLVVSVGKSYPALMAPVQAERRVALGLAAAVTVVLLAVLALLLRELEARAQVERSLRESEGNYRDLVDALPQKVWITDPDGAARYLNRAMRLFHGPIGERLDDRLSLIHPDDRARVTEARRRNMAAGIPFSVDLRLRRQDGAYRWHMLSMVPLQRGGRTVEWVGTSLDIDNMRRAEDRVRRSEERLTLALEASRGGLWDWNVPTGALYMSDRGYAMLGLEPGEIEPNIGAWEALVHPDDKPAALAALRAHLDGNSPVYEAEYRTRHRSGEWIWVLDRGAVVARDGEERPVRVSGVRSDVTERRRTEAALQESEARYRLLADNGSDLIVLGREDGTRTYISPAVRSMLGYTVEEAHARGMRDFIHPDDVARVFATTQGLTAARPEGSVVYRLRRKDGAYVWAEAAFRRVEDGPGPATIITAIRDVTKRKQAEEALRESKEFAESLLAASADCIKVMDLEGRLQFMNRSGVRLLELDDFCQIQGACFADIFPEDGQDSVRDAIARAAGGASASLVIFCPTAKGSPCWWDISITPVVDEAGRPAKLLATSRNVTERHLQAEELRAAKEGAELANQAKTDFLASMSHEIRTPLNGVLGFADLLLDDADLNDNQRRHAERIQSAGAALLTVVNDILDFSKIEAGQIELDPQPFALDALIDNAVSIVRGLADRKRLELRVEVDDAVPRTLVGDQDRLRQVLLNLLNNAVKFTPQGRITLAVDRRREDATPGRASLCIAVTDTGIGIPESKQARLFQRFSQVDGSIQREFGGTGLGLAISKRLVELMGGEIGVRSNPGQGSTFWFSVDLASGDGRVVADQGPQAETRLAARPASILLVEDVEVNQEIARAVLEQAGHQVDVVGDGADAIMAVQSKAYDVVLMDVQMPGMNGITATRHIRALKGFERLPIVALTANVLPSQMTEFRQAGMNDHVGKPFQRAQLLAAVERWTHPGPEADPASEAPAPAEPTFDPDAYGGMIDLVGWAKVSAWLVNIREQLGELTGPDGAPAPDRAQTARTAHGLVSSAGMLGFTEASQACARLEAACLSGGDLAAASRDVAGARARALEVIVTLEAGEARALSA